MTYLQGKTPSQASSPSRSPPPSHSPPKHHHKAVVPVESSVGYRHGAQQQQQGSEVPRATGDWNENEKENDINCSPSTHTNAVTNAAALSTLEAGHKLLRESSTSRNRSSSSGTRRALPPSTPHKLSSASSLPQATVDFAVAAPRMSEEAVAASNLTGRPQHGNDNDGDRRRSISSGGGYDHRSKNVREADTSADGAPAPVPSPSGTQHNGGNNTAIVGAGAAVTAVTTVRDSRGHTRVPTPNWAALLNAIESRAPTQNPSGERLSSTCSAGSMYYR